MTSIIPYETEDLPAPPSSTTADFLAQVTAQLTKEADTNGGHLRWNSSGTGFSFNCADLENYLHSDASAFEQSSVETFIGQLKHHGFVAIAAEPMANENEDEESCLAFAKPQFTRSDLHRPTPRPDKPTKPFYCSSEKTYVQYKRANDPCYKLMTGIQRNAFDKSKDRFRAVLAQQKLKRIVMARQEDNDRSRGADVFADLLPNETNIAIQMGAIAGYYGETVIEEDLIKFFGKFLPMYKPISDVVDSITPSISNKIQANSFIWRNNSSSDNRQPTAIVNQSTRAETAQPIDPCNDITFEYVSFKDQVAPVMQTQLPEKIQENKTTTTRDISDMDYQVDPTAIGIVNVVGQGITSGQGEAVIITQQQRDEFMPISGGILNTNGDCDGDTEQMHITGDNNATMQQFTNHLLDSNYYTSSSSGHDFGLELKNAIDLIMN